ASRGDGRIGRANVLRQDICARGGGGVAGLVSVVVPGQVAFCAGRSPRSAPGQTFGPSDLQALGLKARPSKSGQNLAGVRPVLSTFQLQPAAVTSYISKSGHKLVTTRVPAPIRPS